MAQETSHPEEKLLEELKKEYTSQGILQARTPREKMTQNINTVDEILRSEHLAQESTVESLLAQVTMKMSASQKLQGMVYLTKRIASLLEGGDEVFKAQRLVIDELARKLDEQVELQKHSASTELAKTLNQAVSYLAKANLAMHEVESLQQTHAATKTLMDVLQQQGPAPAEVQH
ncbi:MAG: hypothetical protein Q8P50_00980 [Bacillota bacterium]|nr:hypothetical protein [Bacillota bacterium]